MRFENANVCWLSRDELKALLTFVYRPKKTSDERPLLEHVLFRPGTGEAISTCGHSMLKAQCEAVKMVDKDLIFPVHHRDLDKGLAIARRATHYIKLTLAEAVSGEMLGTTGSVEVFAGDGDQHEHLGGGAAGPGDDIDGLDFMTFWAAVPGESGYSSLGLNADFLRRFAVCQKAANTSYGKLSVGGKFDPVTYTFEGGNGSPTELKAMLMPVRMT